VRSVAAIATAISSAAAAATASAASTLFRFVAILTVDGPISTGLKRNRGGLSAAGANYGCFGASGTVTGRASATLLAKGASALLGLAA